jgi:hypothetical protein
MNQFSASEVLIKLSDLALRVADHLNVSPNPNDKDFHTWADSNGIERDKAEAAAYELASIFTKFLYGGRAAEKGITEADVDSEELFNGTIIEHEHTSDSETARRIALDHLAETNGKRYYASLKTMEELIKRHRKVSDENFRKILENIGKM